MFAPISYAVTTATKPTPGTVQRAADAARALGLPHVERQCGPIGLTAEYAQVGRLLITEHDAFRLWDSASGTSYTHHPNLLPIRARGASNGGHDLLYDALRPVPGMSVLDGTAGFGTEAALCALWTGASGSVTALERDPVLAYVTRDGMAHVSGLAPELNAACRRVAVETADFRDYLKAAPAQSVDAVYLDPFFDDVLPRSGPSVSPLRVLGSHTALQRETITDAVRVCRLRVVVKRPKEAPLPQSWGMAHTVSTRKSRVVYHVWAGNSE